MTEFFTNSGRKVSYLQHFDGTGDVRVAGRTGGEYDAYCSAPGKIVASVGCSAFTLNGDSKSVIERLKPAVLEAAKQITVCLGKK